MWNKDSISFSVTLTPWVLFQLGMEPCPTTLNSGSRQLTTGMEVLSGYSSIDHCHVILVDFSVAQAVRMSYRLMNE